nr:MAG TPA: hypothetical protein [Bacteriophage sp.]
MNRYYHHTYIYIIYIEIYYILFFYKNMYLLCLFCVENAYLLPKYVKNS